MDVIIPFCNLEGNIFGRTLHLQSFIIIAQDPLPGACNCHIFVSRHLRRPIYFWIEFPANSDLQRSLVKQSKALSSYLSALHYALRYELGILEKKERSKDAILGGCGITRSESDYVFAGNSNPKLSKIDRSVKTP